VCVGAVLASQPYQDRLNRRGKIIEDIIDRDTKAANTSLIGPIYLFDRFVYGSGGTRLLYPALHRAARRKLGNRSTARLGDLP
jgi:hypothetical protein